MILGLAASESRFDFQSLFRVVFNHYLTVILTIRTWAVWNRNKHLTIILPILFVLVWGSCFVFLGKFLVSMRCEHSYSYPTLTRA